MMIIEDRCMMKGDKRLVCVLWYLDSDVHIVVSNARAAQSGDSPALQPHLVVRRHPLRNLRETRGKVRHLWTLALCLNCFLP